MNITAEDQRNQFEQDNNARARTGQLGEPRFPLLVVGILLLIMNVNTGFGATLFSAYPPYSPHPGHVQQVQGRWFVTVIYEFIS